jgi:hypothetical protein
MLYSTKTNSAITYLDSQVETNKLVISDQTLVEKTNAERLIDLQCNIASYFVAFIVNNSVLNRKKELNSILYSSFHKNIVSMYSAIKLSELGLYGPARPLLRNIFEWLLLAKFSNVAQSDSVLKAWYNQKPIFLSNSVFKKINSPDTKPFEDMWSMLCEYTHASRSSIQGGIDSEDPEILEESIYNFLILNILLECNYHLLNTHMASDQLIYYSKFYCERAGKPTKTWRVSEYRKECHSIFKENRSFLSKEAVKLIAAYKKKWIVT